MPCKVLFPDLKQHGVVLNLFTRSHIDQEDQAVICTVLHCCFERLYFTSLRFVGSAARVQVPSL